MSKKSLAADAPVLDVMTDAVGMSYLNRELSLLDFNERVVAQAKDSTVPLLERLKFLCISSSNLDEFFEIRVAGLKQLVIAGLKDSGPDNREPALLLNEVSTQAHLIVAEQYRVLNEVLLPELAASGIAILRAQQWSKSQAKWVTDYFESDVLPVLSPLGLDPAHPFPQVLNKSLNFIVSLHGKDAFGREVSMAVVPAPRSLSRLVKLETTGAEFQHVFVSLSEIIRAHIPKLFPDMTVVGVHQFRVTRNSNLFVDEEEVDDLLVSLEGELPSRRYGDAVRLEIEKGCPAAISFFLLNHFNLSQEDLYEVDGPVNLNRLAALPDEIARPDLKYLPFFPSVPERLVRTPDMFEAITTGDILLLHPFQSFSPVLEFLRQAAADPNVLVIKQTLYRTGLESVFAKLLIDAAAAGKEVTVVVELRARFDEEANISLATRLQEAGVHVVYGVVGYKTHGKMLMVVRKENGNLVRYVHLSTGNYNSRTARLYTDYGFLTRQKGIGEDIHNLFLQLTGLGKVTNLKKLLQSPFTLQKKLLDKIKTEIENANAGKPAHIMAKMNALTEPLMMKALCAASQAGVRVDLIIRGICCLRPGVKGVSENIFVRSVIGRFLEHTRVYYFLNDGEEEIYLASADLMTRNLSRRVEIAFPICAKDLKERIYRESFELYLKDDTSSWTLGEDGKFTRVVSNSQLPTNAQQLLLQHFN